MISLIAAMGKNRVIGKDNQLVWRLPNDLKHFKDTTIGKKIVMGRKTFASIGKPLPKRDNIILTRNKNFRPKGTTIIHNLEDIAGLSYGNEEVIIIGGSKVYEQVITLVDRMYITYIDEYFEGDAYFPKFDESKWVKTSCEKGKKDLNNVYDYYFLTFERM